MFFDGQRLLPPGPTLVTEVSFLLSLSILSMHCFSPTLEVPRKHIFTKPEDCVKKHFLLYCGHLWVPSLNKVLWSRQPGPTLVPGVFNIFLYCHLFMNQILWVGPGYRDRTLSVKIRKTPEN